MNSFQKPVRVVRPRSSRNLRHHVARQFDRCQGAAERHGDRDCRVDVAARDAGNQENHERQSPANHERLSRRHKDGQNEKEGSNKLGNVGGRGDTHGF